MYLLHLVSTRVSTIQAAMGSRLGPRDWQLSAPVKGFEAWLVPQLRPLLHFWQKFPPRKLFCKDLHHHSQPIGKWRASSEIIQWSWFQILENRSQVILGWVMSIVIYIVLTMFCNLSNIDNKLKLFCFHVYLFLLQFHIFEWVKAYLAPTPTS